MNKRWYKARPVVQKVTAPDGKILDSESELKLYLDQLADFDCHQCKIPYVIAHTYNPDFTYTTASGRMLIVECKGFFQDSAEAAKYKHIRAALNEGDELVFVFDKPDSPLPWSKKRKDGTRMTHGEWAQHNNFRYYSPLASREEILGDFYEA